MKKNSKLNALLATTACSMLTMSCAKELPELPLSSFPAIPTYPELPPISEYTAQENQPTLPVPARTGKNTELTVAAQSLPPASARYQTVDLSSIKVDQTPHTSNRALEIIANDLVAALSFISGMSPRLITVKAPADTTQFDELVKDAFASKGYAINNTRALNAGKQLTTSFVMVDTSNGTKEVTGIISIDNVLVKRTYSVTARSIEASTSYLIKGADPQMVKNSDQVQTI